MISLARVVSSPRALPLQKDLQVWALTLASIVPTMWLLLHGQMNTLAAIFAFMSLLIASVLDKPFAIRLTLIYLFLLGDIRRIIGWLVGFAPLDPMLLVGPAISALLVLPLLLRLRLTDGLSKAVFALMTIMALEIVNPRQGPIAVGVSGAIFYLVPLLWFWLGRRYGADSLLHALIYRVVIPMGVLAALLGLAQTYIGFLPWEKAWITAVAANYQALNLGNGFIRSFGFSVNSVEFIDLLLVSSTCTVAAFFSGKRSYGLLLPLLLVALFLASSRTAIIRLLFAMAASWALSSKGGKGWTLRLIIALAVGVGVLAFSLSHVSTESGKAGQSSAASSSAQHQLQGLEHPLDSKYSTAGLHVQMFVGGIVRGFKYPIGNGLGSTTLGAGKFGGDASASGSSEVDISDAYISLGVIGGTVYLCTILMVLRQAIRFGRSASKSLALPTIGILAALVGSWIALGQYAISPLVWFLIGVLSRYGASGKLPQETAA